MIEFLSLTIWGRLFSLPVVYDCLSDGIASEEQIKTVDDFIRQVDRIDDSKSKVEEYCKDAVMEDVENSKKDNIFSYIKPEAVFVKRDKEHPRIAIMCKYRYDEEHGLAIVFGQDGSITVGIQDIII